MRPVAEQYKAPLKRREIAWKPSQHRYSDAGLEQLKMPHLKAPFHHTNNTKITTIRQCWVPQIGGNLHSQSYYCFMVSWYIWRLKDIKCYIQSCFSLPAGHHSSLTVPNLQPTTNQERNDQCGNQHYSREIPMIGIVVPETCWAYKKYNK